MLSQAHRGHLAMLLFSLLVAGSFSLGGMAANLVDPTALMAVRFLIASALVGAIVAVRGDFKRDYLQAPWRYFAMGAMFALYFVLMFEGLKTAPPVSTSAVFTLTPIMSAGFGYLLLRQITTPWMALALAMAAAGALWVIFRGDLNAMLALDVGRGELLFFIGCISHALYTPFVRWSNRGEPALFYTFGVLVAGFIILSIYGAPAILATDWLALPGIVWITLFYIAIFASATTFFLLQYATMRLPSAKVMAYTYLVPTWVIVWEGLLGHGMASAYEISGVALTILALLMLLRER